MKIFQTNYSKRPTDEDVLLTFHISQPIRRHLRLWSIFSGYSVSHLIRSAIMNWYRECNMSEDEIIKKIVQTLEIRWVNEKNKDRAPMSFEEFKALIQTELLKKRLNEDLINSILKKIKP